MTNRIFAGLMLTLLCIAFIAIGTPIKLTSVDASPTLSFFHETIEVSQPTQLTTDTHYERDCSFLIDQYGTYWLFFARGRGDTSDPSYNPENDFYDIYYLKSTDDGVTWTEYSLPSSINDLYGQREMAVFEAPGYNQIVVYFTDVWYGAPYGTPTNKIYWTYTTNNGTTWSTPVTSGIPGVTGYHVDALWDDVGGSVYVFYEGPGALIYVIKYHGGWGSSIQISENGKHGGIPKAMIDSNGDLQVVWCGWSEGGIYRSNSSDGATWSTPQLIMTSSYVACDPVLVEDASGYTLFWAPWDSGTDSQWIEVMNSTDCVSWSTSKRVTSGGYGTNYWWDMWPEAYVKSSGDMLLFYGTELSGSGGSGGYSKGDGNIWMFEVDWDLQNHHYEFLKEAVDDAPPGETILVHDGTYNETLYIDKNLNLKAASTPIIKGSELFTTDYGDREAVIFVKDAANVLIEGFDIEGEGLGPARNYGVLYQNSGGKILDCTVSPNTVGDMGSVGIAGISRADLTIQDCTIENCGRIGVYATNVEEIIIKDNEIIGQTYSLDNLVNYGIEIEDYDGASTAQIIGNEIYNCDNTHPSPLWSSAAIIIDIWAYYYDLPLSTVSIESNDIHDNYEAIEIVGGNYSHAHYNNFNNNRYGVWNYPNFHGNNGTFDARFNWWGHASGPNHTSSWTYMGVLTVGPNPGSGDSVSDYVLYDPWLEIEWPPTPLPTLAVEPSSHIATSHHETFDINITVSDIMEGYGVQAIQFRLQFNTTLLEVMGVTEGPFMAQAGSTNMIWMVQPGDPWYGDHIIVGVVLLPHIMTTSGGIYTDFPEGSGTVATITFRAIYQQIGLENPPLTCDLTLADTLILNDNQWEIEHNIEDGYYEIWPWPKPTMWVEPETFIECKLNETFGIDVKVGNLHASLMKPVAVEFRMLFNSTLLEVVGAVEGPLIQSFGDTFFIYYVEIDDDRYGSNIIIGILLLPNIETGLWDEYVNGTGTVATINFKSIYQHVGLEKPPLTCNLTLTATWILDENMENIEHTIENWGTYEIMPNHIADINWDYLVDMRDVGIAARAFGADPTHERWNPAADVTGPEGVPDEQVDMRDIAIIARNFGWAQVC
jgi:hypothetical protein